MNQYPNIVWFLVDSIRTYPTDQDLRGKLPIMEVFGQQSVEFTTCVTTAPSTIMSITAMMTGLPAYFLARNYDEFRIDNRLSHPLNGILKQHGYSSFAFLRGLETREKLSSMLDPIPHRFWPLGVSHRLKWTNSDLNRALDLLLSAGIPQPSFLFFHYTPQTRNEKKELIADSNVNAHVEEAWKKLVSAGFTPDNTITIMCSDHGFPDPSTGLTSDWEFKHHLTHDLVLTDDNILIPLYIQYPGSTPKKITTPVSSLDLYPTLLDLVGIQGTAQFKETVDGHTLVPLMQLDDESLYPRRYFRCDARLMVQTGRATAIRSRTHKYICFHDKRRVSAAGEPSPEGEVLIDLINDPLEGSNLLLNTPLSDELTKTLDVFRDEFMKTETRAIEYQINYLLTRHKEVWKRRKVENKASRILLMFEPNTAGYMDIALQTISRAYSTVQVDILTTSEPTTASLSLVQQIFYYSLTNDGESLTFEQEPSALYDNLILFVKSFSSTNARRLLNDTKQIKSRQRLIVDCNFNTYTRRRFWYYRVRVFIRRLRYMTEDPRLLLSQLRLVLFFILRQIHIQTGSWERWNEDAE